MPSEDPQYNINQTYLALRIAMIMLIALLFMTILAQWWFVSVESCLQASISAYYFTSVRPVFVGALCAIGAGMIIYRGDNDYENIALDYTGFMAFIVAFVPTTIDKACQPTNGPDTSEIKVAVGTNVGALLVIGVIATVVGFLVRSAPPAEVESNPWYAKISVGLTLLALSIGIYLYLFQNAWFVEHGHICAAILLFIGIVTVVGANARNAPSGKYTVSYWVLFGFMVLSLLIGGGFWLAEWPYWALFLEALIIFWYAVFWIVQTVELEGRANRAQAEPAGDQEPAVVEQGAGPPL